MIVSTTSRFPASNLLAQDFDHRKGRVDHDGAIATESVESMHSALNPKSGG